MKFQYTLGQYYFTTDLLIFKTDGKNPDNAFVDSRQLHLDFIKARDWYLKSANQGFVPAQDALAILYNTEGPLRDIRAAYFWMRLTLKNTQGGIFGGTMSNDLAIKNLSLFMTAGERESADRQAMKWAPVSRQ